jgi:hypothetical protein
MLRKQESEYALCFVGDLSPSCFYSKKPEILEQRLAEIRNQVPTETLLFFNLECSIVAGKTGRDTEANIKALCALESLKPAVACLANNHHFDNEPGSSKQTTELLNKLGIPYVGIYEGQADFFDILEYDGLRIGVVARVAKGTNPKSFNSNGKYIHPLEYDEILSACESLVDKVDVSIVCLHWGAEYYKIPSPRQKRFVHALSKIGVDVVWGHHAHVLQPRVQLGKMLVMYGMGNFIFGQSSEGRWPEICTPAILTGYEKSSTNVTSWEIGFDAGKSGNPLRLKTRQMVKKVESNPASFYPVRVFCWFVYRVYMEIFFFGANYLKKRVMYNSRQDKPSDILNSSDATRQQQHPGIEAVVRERLRRIVSLWEDE